MEQKAGVTDMDDQALTTRIDEALREFTNRDLISGVEVVDFLLDLRLMLLAAEEAQPVTS